METCLSGQGPVPTAGDPSPWGVQAEVQAGQAAAPVQAAAATERPHSPHQAPAAGWPGNQPGHPWPAQASLSLSIAPLGWVQAELRRQGCPEAVAGGIGRGSNGLGPARCIYARGRRGAPSTGTARAGRDAGHPVPEGWAGGSLRPSPGWELPAGGRPGSALLVPGCCSAASQGTGSRSPHLACSTSQAVIQGMCSS